MVFNNENDKYGTRLENKKTGASYLKAITDPAILDEHYVISQSKDKNKRAKFAWNPMDADWKERCSHMWWFGDNRVTNKTDLQKFDERLYTLRDRLLSFGGESACLPMIEEDLTDILEKGQFWFGSGAKRMKGADSQCHRNSCDLYESNKDNLDVRICTGYALSDDGMWRQHSWLICHSPRSNQISESHEHRIGYYGFVSTPEQCDRFCDANW